ncbi:MAG: glycosyltransferase [Gammaproteobacteria bacterium]|nr:glycosyltransferase [Gammaproteobacteria bacterium]
MLRSQNKPNIKVLMTSTSYPKSQSDWQGVFIRDMVNAISDIETISLSVWSPPGDFPKTAHYIANNKDISFFNTLLAQGGIAHLLRNKKIKALLYGIKLIFLANRACKRSSDIEIYHVNWLQNALSIWHTKQPLLVTVLGTDLKLLNLPGMTYLLRRIFKHRHTIIAPNAQWMLPKLTKSFGDIAEIRPIPFGIHSNWFLINRNINFNKPKIWLVILRITKSKIGELFNWGNNIYLNDDDNQLHLFGPNQDNIKIPDWVNYHGSTSPSILQKNWFPKAAGLITLSKHDEGRPQIILEAMAAGLPIIASDIEAHKNFITNMENGLIVNSEKQFHQSIQYLSDLKNNNKIAVSAKHWVSNEIGTWDDCAKRYLKAYLDLKEKKICHQMES